MLFICFFCLFMIVFFKRDFFWFTTSNFWILSLKLISHLLCSFHPFLFFLFPLLFFLFKLSLFFFCHITLHLLFYLFYFFIFMLKIFLVCNLLLMLFLMFLFKISLNTRPILFMFSSFLFSFFIFRSVRIWRLQRFFWRPLWRNSKFWWGLAIFWIDLKRGDIDINRVYSLILNINIFCCNLGCL